MTFIDPTGLIPREDGPWMAVFALWLFAPLFIHEAWKLVDLWYQDDTGEPWA